MKENKSFQHDLPKTRDLWDEFKRYSRHTTVEKSKLDDGVITLGSGEDSVIQQWIRRMLFVLEQLPLGIFLTDEEDQIIWVNDLLRGQWTSVGLGPRWQGQEMEDILAYLTENTPDIRGKGDASGEPRALKGVGLKTRDDRVFSWETCPVWVEDTYGGTLGFFQDITETFFAEQQVRASEEKYRGIIEKMELGLLEVDNNGQIVKAYERFCAMTGYTSEELLGKDANEVLLVPEYLPVIAAQDAERKEGKAGVYEIEIFTKDRQRLWVLISGAPFYDHHGQLQGSIGIHYDISGLKRLQKELEEARLAAESAREVEKAFLANMSHEIRNPIHSIVGMTHLLLDTPLTEEQMQYLNAIRHSTHILQALVSDILDISKIQDGEIEVKRRDFDLVALMEALAENIRFRLSDSPVSLVCEPAPELKGTFYGDPTLLNQILLNLLKNAIKFTEKGKIGLSMRVSRENGDHVWVRFEVWDTGIGIPEADIPYIFDRFKQGGKDIKVKYGGSGLGLYITHELVGLLGGTVEVESQPGQGSRFGVDIPLLRKVSQPEPPPITVAKRKISRVLIVEDNPVNQQFLTNLMQKWNFAYEVAGNGKEAVVLLDNQVFDLILMDIRMPEMDGYETTIHLRNQKNNPNQEVPIIALTASALMDAKEKALSVGMNYHMSKPFTPDQLMKAISQFDQEPLSVGEASSTAFAFDPALDAETLANLYGDDRAYALCMFEAFLDIMPEELDRLRVAIADEDRAQIGEIAHKVKPNFSMVGLIDLHLKARKLEKEAKAQGEPAQILADAAAFIESAESQLPLIQREAQRLQALGTQNA